jgi:catalase (peroxidase I)
MQLNLEQWEAIEEEAQDLWDSPKDIAEILFDEGVELSMPAVDAMLRAFEQTFAAKTETAADQFLKAFHKWLHCRVMVEAERVVERRMEVAV